jgi:hypothetical protein
VAGFEQKAAGFEQKAAGFGSAGMSAESSAGFPNNLML